MGTHPRQPHRSLFGRRAQCESVLRGDVDRWVWELSNGFRNDGDDVGHPVVPDTHRTLLPVQRTVRAAHQPQRVITGYSGYSSLWYNTEGLPYFSVGMANFGVQMAKSMGALGGAGPAAAEAVPGASLPGLGGMGGMLGGGGVGSPISAGLGNAASLGKLSVPSSWAGTTPAPSTAPVSVEGLAPASPETGGPGNLLGGMPLTGGPGLGAAHAGPRYGFRPTVMARPPFAG